MKSQNPSSPSSQDQLITSAETCEILSISMPTLRRYVRAGHLAPKRLPGGRLRFNRSDVLNLLA